MIEDPLAPQTGYPPLGLVALLIGVGLVIGLVVAVVCP